MAQLLPPPDRPRIEIVITGRALPEPESERAYSVEMIDRRRIERSPSHELDQLLKEVPGLQLFRRSDARSGHPTSQGVTLRALGGNASSRALLVLDGVPQSDPFGGWVNWPAYDLETIEQLRIVRGGGSVAYGPGALAGTIEMSSRTDARATGDVSAGTRDSIEGRGRLGLTAGRSLLTIGLRGSRSDGFVPITEDTRGPADKRAPYREWSSRGRWVAPLGGTTEVQANLSGFHDWRTRGTDFTENRTNGADASVRAVNGGRWQWSALGYWQWRNLKSSFASVSPGRAIATRVSLQDSVPSHGIGASFELRPPMPQGFELRLGADARRTDGESRELFAYVGGEPTRRRFAGGESWTSGIFAETTANLGLATLSGGVRLDHWGITDGHLFEQTIATGAILRDDQFADRNGWEPTGRIGAVAKIGESVALRSAAYLGWRMPTLNELFRPFRAGLDATAANPELDSERLAGAEAGIDVTTGNVTLSVTGFVNRLKDSIANVTLGEGPGAFPGVGFVASGGQFRQRQNIDAINVRGIEGAAEWVRGPWSARAGLSWTHARVNADNAAAQLDGLRPAQTPNFVGTLAFGWDKNGRAAQLVLRHVGAQFEDDLNERSLDSATTLDAFASWPLSERVQLVARAENLTDTLIMAGIGGDGSIERATPRTFWIGLRLAR